MRPDAMKPAQNTNPNPSITLHLTFSIGIWMELEEHGLRRLRKMPQARENPCAQPETSPISAPRVMLPAMDSTIGRSHMLAKELLVNRRGPRRDPQITGCLVGPAVAI